MAKAKPTSKKTAASLKKVSKDQMKIMSRKELESFHAKLLTKKLKERKEGVSELDVLRKLPRAKYMMKANESIQATKQRMTKFYALHDYLSVRTRKEREEYLGEVASMQDIRFLATALNIRQDNRTPLELRNAVSRSYFSGVAKALGITALVVYSPVLIALGLMATALTLIYTFALVALPFVSTHNVARILKRKNRSPEILEEFSP